MPCVDKTIDCVKTSVDFKNEQKHCDTLKEIRHNNSKFNSSNVLENGVFVNAKSDKIGKEKGLIIENRAFGLKNAPFCFSKLLEEVLQGCEECAIPYLVNDAILFDSWESHLKHQEIVLKKISQANLTIKPTKCRFTQKIVPYLGHCVG